MFNTLIDLFKSLFTNFKKPMPPVVSIPTPPVELLPNRYKIYQTALLFLGRDASPLNLVPKEFACAESVSYVLQQAGFGVGIVTGTYTLREKILKSWKYDKVDSPQKGDVLISATGTGNGNIPNGHCAVLIDNNLLASNNSYTGMWDTHYTIDSWKKRYVDIGGYKMEWFSVR